MLLKLGDGCSRIVQYASYLNGDYYEMVFSRDPLSNQEYLKSSLHYSIIYFHILKHKYCTTSKITGTSNRHCNSLKITSIYYTQPRRGSGGGLWGLEAPPWLDQKFCATPKICKKLVCSSKTVDSRAVFPKTALKSTVLELQTSFLHIFGVAQNF